MKIGFNLIQYTDLTGIEAFTQKIITHFQLEPDDELVLFTNQKSKELFGDLNPVAKIINKDFGHLNRFYLILYQQFDLPRALKKQKIDLLFCPSLALPLLWRRKIVTIHDLAFLRFRNESSLLFRIYLRLALLSAKYFSLAIGTVSEFARQEIVKLMKIEKDKIFIIGNGQPEFPIVVANRCQAILKKFNLVTENGEEISKKPYFVYIGNTYPRKNLPKTIKAFQLFSAKRPEYCLILAGKKDQRQQELAQLADELGLKNKVLFPGFISQEEKIALIKGATALVIISLYEGFGLPVLEAQALGTPVLAAKTSSLPEVAGDAAVLINPNDLISMADGFEKIANDEQLRQTMIASGYKNISRYSWVESAKQLRANFLTKSLKLSNTK